MKLDETRNAFLVLHGEVTHLLSEVLRPRSRWLLIVQRRQLRQMEDQFVALSQRFDVLDSQLVRHMKLPKDYDAFRTTSTFDLFGAVREAVRAKLSETQAVLGSMRNQAGSRSSRAVIVIGLAVAIGLVVAIVVLLV
jgi:hypothetical protein